MDYVDSFYNNSIGENDLGNIAAQELSAATTTQLEQMNQQQQQQQQQETMRSMPQQTFYPTPNSTNMHPGQIEKSFMSPFPAFYPQKYPTMGTETSYPDFDEV
ncbi:MAG: hypothetical protein EOO77_16145 [Oxalobacteraceae bacterium]|nr:MAG: hypothetical protein EOO77_16145 [Oxalobacteraceae bacterium]